MPKEWSSPRKTVWTSYGPILVLPTLRRFTPSCAVKFHWCSDQTLHVPKPTGARDVVVIQDVVVVADRGTAGTSIFIGLVMLLFAMFIRKISARFTNASR
jgi:hypothetical protein